MDVVIFGNGGHGRDIAASFSGRVQFRDDDPGKCHGEKPRPRKGIAYIIGVNDPKERATIYRRLRGPLGRYRHLWDGGRWVHPSASVDATATVGIHTHINAGAFLTRCTIGDFVTVGPNATICGDVTIGDRCMIGAGAVIKNMVTIGNDVTVGCGAVVVNDLPDGVTVVGNPARELVKRTTPDDLLETMDEDAWVAAIATALERYNLRHA